MSQCMMFNLVYSEVKSKYKLGNPSTKFSIWRSKINFALFDLGVDYVLTQPKPGSTEENYNKWMKDDYTCRHILLGTMEDDVFRIFDAYQTAKDMMDGITTLFKLVNWPECSSLVDKYTTHKMSDKTPIVDHIIYMRALAKDLEDSGINCWSEDMQVETLMQSLPKSYEPTVLAYNVNNTDPTYNKWIPALKIQESIITRKCHRKDEEEKRQRNGKNAHKGNCYSCGEHGHYQNDCPGL